ERLDLIIDKMMARDPKHRYSSCAEVIHDLERLNLAGETLSFAAADGAPPVRRRSAPATMALHAGNQTTPLASPGPQRSGGSQRSSAERAAQRRTAHDQPAQRRSSGDQAAQRQSVTHAAGPAADWYVRHTDKTGKVKVSKMSTNQVPQGVRCEPLDLKTRITRDPPH